MSALVGATAVSGVLHPVALRCEYKVNPIGIDVEAPRLYWTLEAKRRAQKQTAYQILVAGSEASLKADKGDVWDSGKVASDDTTQIVYGGRPLASGERVWWKVRSWDREGNPSAFSSAAYWETGLLRHEDWKAQWIGQNLAGASAKKAHNGYHSEFAQSADDTKWVTVDLGSPHTIDALKLYPTRPFDWQQDVPGMFFPVRFRIEVSDSPEFTDAKTIVDQTGADVPNPGTDAPTFRFAPVAARYVRLTGTRLRERSDGKFALALAEMQVLSGEKNLALRARVTAKDSVEYSNWSTKNLTDGDLTSHPASGSAPAPYLRKTFQAAKAVRRARLYASARGLYKLYVNGKRVSSDIFRPGWTDYRKRIQYDAFDVTALLKQGQNALGVVLGEGWYSGHVGLTGRSNYGAKPYALTQLEIAYTDGTKQTVVSDDSWKVSTGPILADDLLMGETYDARKEIPGWNTADYDDSKWLAVDMEPMDEAPIVAPPGPPVLQYAELKPKTVVEKPSGSWIFDLGQNMVGWARLKVKGEAGKTIRLRFAEMLNPDGSIYVTNLRGAKATDNYTLKGGGEEVYEPSFTSHGFRYVELTGYPGTPKLDAVTGIVVTSATPPAGTFECSNPMVNQLQHNIQWGQRGNYLEVPTDCPQRDERLGWMGDAQIFARTATYNADIAAFMTKWTQDVEDAQSPAGDFSDVSPRIGATGPGSPAWGDAGVIVPWTMYLAYADTRILEKHYAAMVKWIEYIREGNPDLRWVHRSGANYGDWLNINDDMPRDILGTSYFAYSTHLLAKIAGILGKTEDAQKYETLFEGIREAYNKAYVRPDGRIRDAGGHGDTQTCYLMALHFDLLSPEMRTLAEQHLTEHILVRSNTHLATGFVGVGYLCPTLTQIGRTDVAYKLLNNDTFPSWGYSIKHGATTIWERWDGWTEDRGFQDPGMNSFNHYSLGSVGEWMFSTVGGIDLDPANPGFKKIVIRPIPGGGLTYAKASYQSIHGPIKTDWKLAGGHFALNVAIPANTTATVVIPAGQNARVTEGGKPAEQAEGVQLVRRDADAAVYEVGSGSYAFVAE